MTTRHLLLDHETLDIEGALLDGFGRSEDGSILFIARTLAFGYTSHPGGSNIDGINLTASLPGVSAWTQSRPQSLSVVDWRRSRDGSKAPTAVCHCISLATSEWKIFFHQPGILDSFDERPLCRPAPPRAAPGVPVLHGNTCHRGHSLSGAGGEHQTRTSAQWYVGNERTSVYSALLSLAVYACMRDGEWSIGGRSPAVQPLHPPYRPSDPRRGAGGEAYSPCL